MITNVKFLFLIAIAFAAEGCYAQSKNELREPDPQITIDGKYRGGNISLRELSNVSGVIALVGNYPNPTDYKVQSYQAKLFLGDEIRYFKCNGTFITDTLRIYISKMKPYDRLELYDFKLFPRKIIYTPLIFTINSPNAIYNHNDLLLNWEYSMTDTLYKKNIDLSVVKAYEDLPQFVESNCNSITNTCKVNIYYLLDNKKELTLQYEYHNDTLRARYYRKNILISDVGYIKGVMNGMFLLNDSTGKLLKEGFYSMSEVPLTDTLIRINPVTKKEEQQFITHYYPIPDREWKYYVNGNIKRRIHFSRGKVIQYFEN